MNKTEKYSILDHVYHIYQQSIQSFEFSCRIKCAVCCTRNVTLTSLEAEMILDCMRRTNKLGLLKNISEHLQRDRYQPRMTTNQFADMCAKGEDPPEEDAGDHQYGACPLLVNDECQIYPVRPFGCRCFFSDDNCREHGFASLNPWMITLNNLFLQFVEQIDANGKTGNLSDMLLGLATPEELSNLPDAIGGCDSVASLIPNHKISILMVPPNHQKRVQPIIAELRNISKSYSKPFGQPDPA